VTDTTPRNEDERARLDDPDARWRRWGPYLSERAWGTVREDYSADGTAWTYLPHDHARSRAFRWSEDGLGGICDDEQRLCLAFAFWNGKDPILKERIFGLNGNEGNHGEDAKEYWWYLDSTPTHSWMRWAYAYPQAAYPYDQLVHHGRGKLDPELELLDTGVFDEDRYWDIVVDYAKATPDDWCIRMKLRNAGPEAATLHVLPTLWFRNSWSWDAGAPRPVIDERDGALVARHPHLGAMTLKGDGDHLRLFCDNDSNARRLWGVDGARYPKDGIGDHVLLGADTVNPEGTGTKASLWYQVEVEPGATHEILLSFGTDADPDWDLEQILLERQADADGFYGEVFHGVDPEEAMIGRQALGGMLWSKQFFHFDVDRWLNGDPTQPPPPPGRQFGRNSEWRHLNNHDVISMPDCWEYPWYAAWDLAFHCVALAHVDADFAKRQLILMCREWYMHPNGQLPAYEWAFGDVNPPVHAWAALRVWEIDGGTDFDFLERIFHKLLINFTWWVNKKDVDGNNVFEGGFLGLDNIGPIDRSAALPDNAHLEQSDGTAWMGMYSLNMLEIALRLAFNDPTYEDVATKFFEHFAHIAAALEELWDDEDGFYHDVIHLPSGEQQPLKVHSMVGLLPLVATGTAPKAALDQLANFSSRMRWFLHNRPQLAESAAHIYVHGGTERRLFSMVSPERLERILTVMLDEDEFLSPHGLRALSARHRDRPFVLDLAGSRYSVDYEPAESTSGLFGGNSNWRGPVWFPVNLLLIEALRRYSRHFADSVTAECPIGSGNRVALQDVADELSRRLVSLYRTNGNSGRPVNGHYEKLQHDNVWRDRLLFYEYFHGDTGQGLGASHQTGWTGVIADLILRKT
jgi:hypothetical protein